MNDDEHKNTQNVNAAVRRMSPRPSPATAKSVVTRLLTDLKKAKKSTNARRIEAVMLRAAKIAAHVGYRAALLAATVSMSGKTVGHGTTAFAKYLSSFAAFRAKTRDGKRVQAAVHLAIAYLAGGTSLLSGATLYKTLRKNAGLDGTPTYRVRVNL